MNGVVSLLNVSGPQSAEAALANPVATGHRKPETGLLAGVDDGLVGAAEEVALAVDSDGEGRHLGIGQVASFESREAKTIKRCYSQVSPGLAFRSSLLVTRFDVTPPTPTNSATIQPMPNAQTRVRALAQSAT